MSYGMFMALLLEFLAIVTLVELFRNKHWLRIERW